MRVNQFVATATGISRRAADVVVEKGRVKVNNEVARPGQNIEAGDHVLLDNHTLKLTQPTTILLNKPVGYVCSRNGQGSKTVYDLLPSELHTLKPVGRLDKDSSGLLILTTDGRLANMLTHPRYQKEKRYEVTLNKPLTERDKQQLQQGIQLDDGLSILSLEGRERAWTVSMTEGRNRQVRRSFSALGYTVITLHRVSFGPYTLAGVQSGQYMHIAS